MYGWQNMNEILEKIEIYKLIIKFIILVMLSYMSIKNNVEIYYVISFILISIILNLLVCMIGKKRAIFIGILNIIFTLFFAHMFLQEASVLAIIYMLEIFISNPFVIFIYFIVSVLIIYNKCTFDYFFYYISIFVMIFILENFIYKLKCEFARENMTYKKKSREVEILKAKHDLHKAREVQNAHMIKLEERNILSKRLHDKVGHTISGSILQLEAVNLIMDKDIKKSKQMIRNVIEVLRDGMNDIRITLRESKPCSEEFGLNKVKSILNEKLNNTDISYYMEHKGDLDKINVIQWGLIEDAIREGSTNTIKYSKGNKIIIKIEVFNKLIRCEIKDNGEGCNSFTKGIGLSGIEEEVIKQKGKLIIDSKDGFTLTLLFY